MRVAHSTQRQSFLTVLLRTCLAWQKLRPNIALLAFLVSFFDSPFDSLGYTALVAFGDSYTDTGNAPSSPPDYWNGRFSNGPLWIEDLSHALGFDYNSGDNFAVSGSESDELGVQISEYPGTSDPSNVLFTIWSGSNDFGNHLDLGMDDSAWSERINRTVSSLMTACDLLYQKGARQIVAFNQIDLTRVPYILNAYSLSFRNYILGKIQTFNSQLASAIPTLLSSDPGLEVNLIDAYANFNGLLNNYQAEGFTQVAIGALNDPTLADRSFSGPGASYVFWDDQHPTTKVHAMIAGWVAGALPSPPVAPNLAITGRTSDSLQLLISGSAGTTFVCQRSTNLVDWLPIFTNLTASGTVQVPLPPSASSTHAFYRVVLSR